MTVTCTCTQPAALHADGRDQVTLELAAGTTIRALPTLRRRARHVLVAVNGTTVDKERVLLAQGDHLDCFEPVAAGIE